MMLSKLFTKVKVLAVEKEAQAQNEIDALRVSKDIPYLSISKSFFPRRNFLDVKLKLMF